MTEKTEHHLLTVKEAASMLRLSVSALTALRTEGKLPYVRLGKRVLFKRETLLQFINEHQTTN